MDVLKEGGARQFRDPLTVKLMPEATKSKSRKTPVRVGSPGYTLPPIVHRWMQPSSCPGLFKGKNYFICNNPVCQRQRCPILQRNTLRLEWKVPLPVATQSYLVPGCDHATSTKLFFKRSMENVEEIPAPCSQLSSGVPLLEGKTSMHRNSCHISHTPRLHTLHFMASCRPQHLCLTPSHLLDCQVCCLSSLQNLPM